VSATPPLLELRGVAVDAGGRTILALDRLAIAAGETLAVLGANGAGKSTLLRVAGGLRRHDRGEVRVRGRTATPDEVRAISAAVLQRPLLRRGSVRANVETGLRFRRVARDERRRRATEWLERLGLGPHADRSASTVSGGEAQRVSLARALTLAPELLLLDEPFGALDAPARAELLADLRDLLAATATAALLVTHDRHEAAAVADRIAILHAGRLRQLGPAATVLEHPADAACARLLGFDNVLGPELAARLIGAPASHAVRATDVRLTPAGDGIGRVERVLPFGAASRVVVTVEGARLLAEAPAGALAAAVGARVDVAIDPAAARPLMA
jgi:ABC-type sulfate/molybdate transport systems ATPase subunit